MYRKAYILLKIFINLLIFTYIYVNHMIIYLMG